jgi:hypothetical protein
MKLRGSSFVLSSVFVFAAAVSPAQSSVSPQPAAKTTSKVIIDTDIGDDIDDAFAFGQTMMILGFRHHETSALLFSSYTRTATE